MSSLASSPSRRKAQRKCKYPGCREKSHPVWWHASKQGWYVTLPDATRPHGQRQFRLTKGWDQHDEALRQWHELQAKSPSKGKVELRGEQMRAVDLVNLLLDNLEPKLSRSRFGITKLFLTKFCDHMGKVTVAQLRIGGVARIEKWIASNSGWASPSTRRSVVSRVKQVFQFAVDQGLIVSSPIKRLKREDDIVRVSIFTQAQIDAILANAEPAFAKVFKVLLLTGGRPDEICRMTKDDMREQDGLHAVVDHKNQKNKMFKGQKRRVYLLFAELKQNFRGAMDQYPSGPLFRTKTGKGWSVATFEKAFREAAAKPECKKLGLDRHEVRTRSNGTAVRRYEFVPYVCRHTFAYRLLSGFYCDPQGNRIKKNYGEVGLYLGDSAKMVEEVYGKLAKASKMLSEEIG
jgi:integrase